MKHANRTGTPSIDERYNQGAAFMKTKDYDKAAAIFAQIITEKPDHLASLEYLAYIAKELGNLEGSINLLKAIVEISPLYAVGQCNLGAMLKEAGRVEEARDVLARAHHLNPQDSQTTQTLAGLHLELGDKKKAEELFLYDYKISGDAIKLYTYILQQYKIKSKDDPYFQALQKLEKKESRLENDDRTSLHYILAKARKDLKDYDRSFENLLKACALKRATIDFDIEMHMKVHDVIGQFFTADLLEMYKGEALNSRAPVFIVGMPRSGSTLVDQILYSHRDVESVGESSFLNDLMVNQAWLPEHNGAQFSSVPFAHRFGPQQVGREYLKRIAPYAEHAKRVIDKSLLNYVWIGMIRIMFPNAKIIHTRRNPLDCCLSCLSYHFGNDAQLYTYDLTELGLTYRAYAEMMEHWHREFPGAILDVVYEDVVNDFEPQVRRILDYVELPWDENCLRFYESQRHVKTASLTQVRQPIYKTSAGGWQSYIRYLRPLMEALGPYAPEEARELVKALGTPTD